MVKRPPGHEDQEWLMVKRPPGHEDRGRLMVKRPPGHEDRGRLMVKRPPGPRGPGTADGEEAACSSGCGRKRKNPKQGPLADGQQDRLRKKTPGLVRRRLGCRGLLGTRPGSCTRQEGM
jgi:hypothetical protein